MFLIFIIFSVIVIIFIEDGKNYCCFKYAKCKQQQKHIFVTKCLALD